MWNIFRHLFAHILLIHIRKVLYSTVTCLCFMLQKAVIIYVNVLHFSWGFICVAALKTFLFRTFIFFVFVFVLLAMNTIILCAIFCLLSLHKCYCVRSRIMHICWKKNLIGLEWKQVDLYLYFTLENCKKLCSTFYKSTLFYCAIAFYPVKNYKRSITAHTDELFNLPNQLCIIMCATPQIIN